MKKEILIFIGVFLFLTIGMHFKEWTSYPIEHMMALPNSGAYGIGAIHPLVFTLIVYLVIRLPFLLKKLFTRKKKIDIDCE